MEQIEEVGLRVIYDCACLVRLLCLVVNRVTASQFLSFIPVYSQQDTFAILWYANSVVRISRTPTGNLV